MKLFFFSRPGIEYIEFNRRFTDDISFGSIPQECS
ncbi:hypothetical protein HYU13_03730 [Candidatus Woesearchaeota archaeon]|nr:hypothetical protein [Candidatus Woesearchaeota archaeon]